MLNPKLWGRYSWSILFKFLTLNILDIEKCKRFLYLHCKYLPCDECHAHSLDLININNIMSCTDIEIFKEFMMFMYKQTNPYAVFNTWDELCTIILSRT